MYNKNIRGFSIVEIAIVLILMGVLIGGWFKGKQMISNARITSTISQVNAYESALKTFKNTYNAIPGDMEHPDDRLPDCTDCRAGMITPVGDGIVGYTDGASMAQIDTKSEPVRFWLQLYKAGLISDVNDAALHGEDVRWGRTHPKAKIGGGFHAKNGDGKADTIWADGARPKGLLLILQNAVDQDLDQTYQVMSPHEAAKIDRKMDDGKSKTGQVQAAGDKDFCANGGQSESSYEENSQDAHCTLGFRIKI